jgi:putative oxidoreductase
MGRTLLALLRIGVGAGFVVAGIGKFIQRAHEVDLFRHWGIPAPGTSVAVIGGVEIVFGLLLLTGLATRLAALVLMFDMLAALATAGRIDHGFHVVAPPLLALACLLLAARGGGRWQLIDQLDPRPQ